VIIIILGIYLRVAINLGVMPTKDGARFAMKMQINHAIQDASLYDLTAYGDGTNLLHLVKERVLFEQPSVFRSGQPYQKFLGILASQPRNNGLTSDDVTEVFRQQNATKLPPGAPGFQIV
jgi:hypothetical protein